MAAAKHLTPVTLELGGKSPCVVDKHTNISLAAKRIAWGKWVNAGQTCIAPDYILAHEDIADKLVDEIAKYIKQFYGENPVESNDYGRIINDRHYQRLKSYLPQGKLAFGGDAIDDERYIGPTVMTDVSTDSPLMQEEIFGPILPVLKIDSLENAVKFINNRPKPLALYMFSDKQSHVDLVLNNTSSGGVTVNDTLMHIANGALPFGGVGDSGIGAYHGEYSFDTFSHKKAVLDRSTLLDPPVRYAPFTKVGLGALRKILKWTM
jgi:aldehyde dehydrogenase (NAD+)